VTIQIYLLNEEVFDVDKIKICISMILQLRDFSQLFMIQNPEFLLRVFLLALAQDNLLN